MKYSVGISVSEKGVNLILIDEKGGVAKKAGGELLRAEPESVWETVLPLLRDLLSGENKRAEIVSCGASSPAGWFLAADSEGAPIYNFPAGSDPDLKEEVRITSELADKLTSKTGSRFDDSSPLPKILKFKKDHPEIYRKTRKFIPLASFITGKLSGEHFTAAPSFGAGLGFDSISFRWHRFIKELGILPETLPKIIDHGEKSGAVSSPEAISAGLPRGASVSAPAANDMCLFIASGASEPGRWNSHFEGRTVLNSIAGEIISGPLSRIHYLCFEQGSWAARAPVFAGEDSLPEKFSGENFTDFIRSPVESGLTVCPPAGKLGGSLPFIPGEDEGFIIGKPRDDAELFSGYIEGIAYLEKWSFEILEDMGFITGDEVFATGRTEDNLLELRAAVTGKKYLRPAESSPEFGMAVMGFVKTAYSNIPEAVRKTVKFDGVFAPPQQGEYRGKYRKFRSACRAIGYE